MLLLDPVGCSIIITLVLSCAGLSLALHYCSSNSYVSLVVAILCGLFFISLQVREFRGLGIYLNDFSNIGIFYTLTSLHCSHVVLGVMMLGSIVYCTGDTPLHLCKFKCVSPVPNNISFSTKGYIPLPREFRGLGVYPSYNKFYVAYCNNTSHSGLRQEVLTYLSTYNKCNVTCISKDLGGLSMGQVLELVDLVLPG